MRLTQPVSFDVKHATDNTRFDVFIANLLDRLRTRNTCLPPKFLLHHRSEIRTFPVSPHAMRLRARRLVNYTRFSKTPGDDDVDNV